MKNAKWITAQKIFHSLQGTQVRLSELIQVQLWLRGRQSLGCIRVPVLKIKGPLEDPDEIFVARIEGLKSALERKSTGERA